MATRFDVGDHVSWSAEAGHVAGRIIRIRAESDEPDLPFAGTS
ncbi:MAG TPA: hypothetical protein VF304_14330 [Casimicrobiaceae bacterium]